MKFIYHDNIIYTNGGNNSYEEFMESHPSFPLIEGQFFEYKNEIFSLINEEGHNHPQNPDDYQELIYAIGELNV